MLIDGRWSAGAALPRDRTGRYVRPETAFRNWITPDGSPGPTGTGRFRAERGRYHLFVSLLCPWASRALAALKLKDLEGAVTVTVLDPVAGPEGWRFAAGDPDPVAGAAHLHQIYTLADPSFTGRVTVPVLWDRKRRTIVSNESAEIVRMFDRGFGAIAGGRYDLKPDDLAARIEALNAQLHSEVNDGVYKAGFAATIEAHEDAVRRLFAMLATLDARLDSAGPFLFGDRFTESDLRFFVTLVRFDAAYHPFFGCDRARIADHPALSAYLARLLAIPELAATVNMDHIVRGYAASGARQAWRRAA
ncbi:MAG TPA: glutathione S-transferase C-terminal domain-containing protein [Allosphingosinicella sp.]|jgi:putative glutathione S-transferase